MTNSKTFLNPGYLVHSIVMNESELEILRNFIVVGAQVNAFTGLQWWYLTLSTGEAFQKGFL